MWVDDKFHLDTYGFVTACGVCAVGTLKRMAERVDPTSDAGIALAKEAFGDNWEKYKDKYFSYASNWEYLYELTGGKH